MWKLIREKVILDHSQMWHDCIEVWNTRTCRRQLIRWRLAPFWWPVFRALLGTVKTNQKANQKALSWTVCRGCTIWAKWKIALPNLREKITNWGEIEPGTFPPIGKCFYHRKFLSFKETKCDQLGSCYEYIVLLFVILGSSYHLKTFKSVLRERQQMQWDRGQLSL